MKMAPLPPRERVCVCVSCQCQLLLSRDSCVRFLADRNLRHEVGMGRKKFKPATFARDITSTNPGGNSKSLSKAVKRVIKEDDTCVLLDSLQSLDTQGENKQVH